VRGGTPQDKKALRLALDVSPDEESTLGHVHGFHSYPARLHPETARLLVAGFSRASAVVLDPFCGSGTVLVEARLAGRRALGVDVNPLAVELSLLKANGPGAAWAERLFSAADQVAKHADDRRRAKAGATHRYGEEDVTLFAPHVLLELDGIRDGIAELRNEPIERALLLVLSAVLTKVSLRAGDTGRREEPKRLSSGYTIRFFLKRAEDLVRRLEEASKFLPQRAPAAAVMHGDARDLRDVKSGTVDLVVTSPPYPGEPLRDLRDRRPPTRPQRVVPACDPALQERDGAVARRDAPRAREGWLRADRGCGLRPRQPAGPRRRGVA
jgi:hypothetical protein